MRMAEPEQEGFLTIFDINAQDIFIAVAKITTSPKHTVVLGPAI